MKKIIYILILFFLPLFGKAQVEVSGVIKFTSTYDSLRQINGLSSADSLNETLRANDRVYKKFFSQEITINDSVFTISTLIEYPAYEAGMSIFIEIPALSDTVNVPSYLKINQQGVIKIRSVNNSKVGPEIVQSGRILVLLFDGIDFICTNESVYRCPSGFKKINENYCIQKVRNPLATFWNANKICNDQGYHLCSFQEWYNACVNNAGMTAMPQNFEWVHTTSNHNIHALKIGNLSNCKGVDSETTATTGLPMYYRCCYSLR